MSIINQSGYIDVIVILFVAGHSLNYLLLKSKDPAMQFGFFYIHTPTDVFFLLNMYSYIFQEFKI